MRSIFILIFLFLSFCTVQGNDPVKGENLIRNGSFEEGNTYFSSDLIYDSSQVSPGYYSITKDASKLNPSFIELSGHTSGNDHYFIADPTGSTGEKIWCSGIAVAPETEYEFSAWMAIAHESYDNASKIAFTINGNKVGDVASLRDQDWVQYTWKWKSGSTNETVSLCLINEVLTSSGNDLAIDDVEFYSLTPKVVVVRPPVGDTLPVKAHFPFDEATLTDYSKQKLETLLSILTKYPEMHITIVAHTDMYGANNYNHRLSEKRAETIFQYLVSRNISSERIRMESYGEDKLIYQGSSIRDNVKNRRVEFVISGYGQ